jgi:nucleoside-diphosphate-sugar epimerase
MTAAVSLRSLAELDFLAVVLPCTFDSAASRFGLQRDIRIDAPAISALTIQTLNYGHPISMMMVRSRMLS